MLSIDTYYCISGRDTLRQEKTHEDPVYEKIKIRPRTVTDTGEHR